MSSLKPRRVFQDTTVLRAPWPPSSGCWQHQADTQHCSQSPVQPHDIQLHVATATINSQHKKNNLALNFSNSSHFCKHKSNHYFCLMAIFTGGPGTAGSSSHPPPTIPPQNLWGLMLMVILQARCPSCHPTTGVKALKGTQSTNPNKWPGFILSSSTIRFLTEGALILLCWLSNTCTSFAT